MTGDQRRGIVPILYSTRPRAKAQLAGTGIVIASNAIVTCAHVIRKKVLVSGSEEWRPVGLGAWCGGALRMAVGAWESESTDLCCLRFEKLPGAIPLALHRAARLRGVSLAAAGFVDGPAGLEQRFVSDLDASLHERSGRWVQETQLVGGLPGGFSGGPVLASIDNEWFVVGMLQRGGVNSATSRMLAVDGIAAFLGRHRVPFAIAELPLIRRPAAVRNMAAAQTIKAGRHIQNTIVKMKTRNGAQIVEAGGSIVDCEVDQERSET